MALRRLFQFASSVRDVGVQCFKQTHWTRLTSVPGSKLVASVHTSAPKFDLMEFFEDKKNWSKDHIQVGRSWRKPELRLKSNTDLHKLWFILLKERNMLKTMEHFCKENHTLFPNPERIDKVEESMGNLEEVVRERNRAYWELETGESGERPGEMVVSRLGLPFYYRKFQHSIPLHMNARWRKHHKFYYHEKECAKFHLLMNEKRLLAKNRRWKGTTRAALATVRRWPDVDKEAFKLKFPDHNLEKLKDHPHGRPHRFVPSDESN